MEKLKNFMKTALLGGLTVILPVAILAFAFKGVFSFVTNKVQPLTKVITGYFKLSGGVSELLAILSILVICFFIGIIVKTKIGQFIHIHLEDKMLKKIPGYNLVKETIKQFTGGEETPFSSVALVDIYETGALMTGFVTDKHESGHYTVFIPTGPNPTSGNIFHLERKKVFKIDVSVEEAMKAIISCGAGSKKLLEQYKKQYEIKEEA